METKQYKRKFEFWHKDPHMTIKCHIEGELECSTCRSNDLDVRNFYATDVMKGGNMTVVYACRDCEFTEYKITCNLINYSVRYNMEVKIDPKVIELLQSYLTEFEKTRGFKISPSDFASTAIREKMERNIKSLRSVKLAHELHY